MSTQAETSFELASARGGATFTLTAAEGDYAIAAIEALGLHAAARVDLYTSGGLGELFRSFATDWRGWEGTRSWETLEGELAMSAYCDRLGHTFLTISLEQRIAPAWTLRVELVLEAGVLDTLAASAEAFERRRLHR